MAESRHLQRRPEKQDWFFEKTYMTKDEFDIFWQVKDKVFEEVVFQQQASKHGWSKTFTKFENKA